MNKFITGSEFARNKILEVLNLNSDKAVSIHNTLHITRAISDKHTLLRSLNLEKFDGTIFAIIGLLIPRKGHITLLNAVLTLKNNNSIKKDDFKILIIGDGPDKVVLKNFIFQNGIDDFFIFVGFVNNVLDYINITKYLIFTSIKDEDFPFVILEALSMSKPVITSKIAGTTEQVIDNFNGFLFDVDDIYSLSQLILKVLNKKTDYLRLSKNALNFYDNMFSEDIIMKKYLNLFRI